MRLLSLEVEHFRAIRSARLLFGPGLNVVHGPNDRGKSTLTEAIRAVLLVAPGSAEARTFATWNAAAGQFPRVSITFGMPGGHLEAREGLRAGKQGESQSRQIH